MAHESLHPTGDWRVDAFLNHISGEGNPVQPPVGEKSEDLSAVQPWQAEGVFPEQPVTDGEEQSAYERREESE